MRGKKQRLVRKANVPLIKVLKGRGKRMELRQVKLRVHHPKKFRKIQFRQKESDHKQKV